MTPSEPLAGRPHGTAPLIALLDCGPEDAAAQIASLVDLAERLGIAVRTETVSAACTTLSVQLAAESVQRFQAALLLGGATLLPINTGPEALVTVILTTSARPARNE